MKIFLNKKFKKLPICLIILYSIMFFTSSCSDNIETEQIVIKTSEIEPNISPSLTPTPIKETFIEAKKVESSISIVKITNEEGKLFFSQQTSLKVEISDESYLSSDLVFKWYRNRILLTENETGILSNEIMKSFFGNEEEYTPKSSHSYHSIQGYEFSVDVIDELAQKIGSDSITIDDPTEEIEMRGVNLYTMGSFHIEEIEPETTLGAMQSRLNTNWVSIWNHYFQDGLNATEIVSLSPDNYEEGLGTLTDQETKNQINAAHQLGMKVVLYPQIGLMAPVRMDVGHRENIVPTDGWFSAYKEFIIHQAEIAEETDAEILVIGVELFEPQKSIEKWYEIISEVRKHYSGEIAYSPIAISKQHIQDLKKLSWFSELDYIGLSANIEKTSAGSDPTLTEMEDYFQDLANEIDVLANFFGKSVIFLETSRSSWDGSYTKSDLLPDAQKQTPDFQEQADYYQAFLNTFAKQPWTKGIFWNQWFYRQEEWYKINNAWAVGIEFYCKPAERVLASWYGANPNYELCNETPYFYSSRTKRLADENIIQIDNLKNLYGLEVLNEITEINSSKPFRLTLNINNLNSKGNSSISIHNNFGPPPTKVWWEGVQRFTIIFQPDHEVSFDIMDGYSSQNYHFSTPIKSGQTFTVEFSDPQYKIIKIFDEAEELIQTIDISTLDSNDFPDEFFLDDDILVETYLEPGAILQINQFSLEYIDNPPDS